MLGRPKALELGLDHLFSKKVFILTMFGLTCLVRICSGESNQLEEKMTTDNSDVPKKDVKAAAPADDAQSRIQAARERFLARKENK
ncbi:hypothetical protein Tco_0477612 [Tanacetum coccineum]